jgi:hypothetical protein
MPSKHDIDKKRLLARRTFAAKSLAAQTDWLEGVLLVDEGRLYCLIDDSRVEVSAELVANTQRKLYKLRQDREAAEQALREPVAWYDKRQRLLDEVKLLSLLKLKHSSKLTEVLNHLVVKAVAAHEDEYGLPEVLQEGKQAVPALLSLIEDGSLPWLSRSLAAMALGAIQRATKPPSVLKASELLNAYKFGVTHGIDERSTLYNRLLAQKDGPALAARARAAYSQTRWNGRIHRKAVEWVGEGASPLKLVELLENLAKTRATRDRINRIHVNTSKWRSNVDKQTQLLKTTPVCLTNDFADLLEASFDARDSDLPIAASALVERVIVCIESLRAGIDEFGHLRNKFLESLDLHLGLEYSLQADCIRLVEFATRTLWKPETFAKKTDKALKADLLQLHSHELEPIPMVLAGCQDAQLVRRAIEANVLSALGHQSESQLDAETVASVVSAAAVLKPQGCQGATKIVGPMVDSRTNVRTRGEIKQIVALLKDTPYGFGAFEDIFDFVNNRSRIGFKRTVQLASKLLPIILAKTAGKELGCRPLIWPALLGAISLRGLSDASMNELTVVLIEKLVKYYDKIPTNWGATVTACCVAGHLCGGDSNTYRLLFETVMSKRGIILDTDQDWSCLSALGEMPFLLDNLQRAFLHHPGDCAPFFEQLKLMNKLGLTLPQVCAALESPPMNCQCDFCANATKHGDAVQKHWRCYVHARDVLGESHEMAHSITKLIDLPESLAKELHYLEKNNPPANRKECVEKRIEKLRFYKRFPLTLQADVESNLRRELEKLEAHTVVTTATKLMESAIEHKCTAPQLASLGLNKEELFDLLVLRCSSNRQENRTELRRLLSACGKGDLTWPLKQPANRQYMKEMRDKGIDVDTWISAFPAFFTSPGLSSGVLKISLEQNPIEVLKMGVYFNTCLSFDGINAFSSIANATDVNKRVMYVRDSSGKVYARKLIAISEDFELLGYETYVTTMTDEQEEVIETVVNDYAKALAAACGLRLAEDGAVRILVSKSWYDDGTISWDRPQKKPRKDKKSKSPLAVPMICFGEKSRRQ